MTLQNLVEYLTDRELKYELQIRLRDGEDPFPLEIDTVDDVNGGIILRVKRKKNR